MATILKTESILCDLYKDISTKEFILNEIENCPMGFAIHSLPTEKILEIKEMIENLDLTFLKYTNPIIGYGQSKGGNLKFSDPAQNIKGKLTVTPSPHLKIYNIDVPDESIVYEPESYPFNYERDSYVYFYGNIIYTDESLEEILKSFMFDGRKCFLDIDSYFRDGYMIYYKLEEKTPDELYNMLTGQLNNDSDNFARKLESND